MFQSLKIFMVLVIYIEISDPANVTLFTANGEESQLIVDVNSTVHFVCETDGSSQSCYRITRESGYLVTVLQEQTLTATCDASGVYTCSASNNILPESTRSIIVYVNCPAELENPNSNYITYVMAEGNRAIIYISLFGFPFPLLQEIHLHNVKSNKSYLIVWWNQYITNDDFSVEYEYYKGSTTVLFTINNIKETHFSKYTMIFTNPFGSFQYHFQIVKLEVGITVTRQNSIVPAAIGGALSSVTVLAVFIIVSIKRKQIQNWFTKIRTNRSNKQDNVGYVNTDFNTTISQHAVLDGAPNDYQAVGSSNQYDEINIQQLANVLNGADLPGTYNGLELQSDDADTRHSYLEITSLDAYDHVDLAQKESSPQYACFVLAD